MKAQPLPQGVGLGYLPTLHQDFLDHFHHFDFTELRSESFFDMSTEARELGHYLPLTFHGTELSFASLHQQHAPSVYIEKLKKLVAQTSPALISDHMSWTSTQEAQIDLYLPPLDDQESLAFLIAKHQKISAQLGTPLALENVADMAGLFYTQKGNAQAESRFWKNFCAKTQAPILLNLDSLLINAALYNLNPRQLVDAFPAEYIVGLTIVPKNCMNSKMAALFGAKIDQQALALLDYALTKTAATSVLIQRRYSFNTFTTLSDYTTAVKKIYQRRKK